MRITSPPRPTSLSLVFVLPLPLLVLLTAYIWSVRRRPEIPEYAQVNNPHQWGYPSWYSRKVSPYDHRSKYVDTRHSNQDIGKSVSNSREDSEICEHPKKVLLFIDLPYDSPEIPSALSTLSSLTTSSQYNISLVSPLSADWTFNTAAASASIIPHELEFDPASEHARVLDTNVIDNLVANGCETFDWIWRIGHASGEIAQESRTRCGAAVWVEEGGLGGSDVTLLFQPQELTNPQASHAALKSVHGEGWEMGLMAHILPAADPNTFYPSQRKSSRIPIVYFPKPSTASGDYPKLPWGRQWSIYPASRKVPPKLSGSKDRFDPRSPWRRYWQREEQRLATAMRQASICIFEGWEQGLLDERVVKAMLSGCVVASVPVQAEHDVFAPLILPLSAPPDSASPTVPLPVVEIQSLLTYNDISAIKRIAVKAFISARKRLIAAARLDDVEAAVKIWAEGGRGYHLPHGFRWDCGSQGGGGWCGRDETESPVERGVVMANEDDNAEDVT